MATETLSVVRSFDDVKMVPTLRSRSPIEITMPAGLLDLREQVLLAPSSACPSGNFVWPTTWS
jgi:hypothetical protein